VSEVRRVERLIPKTADSGKKRPTLEKNGRLWKLGLCVVS